MCGGTEGGGLYLYDRKNDRFDGKNQEYNIVVWVHHGMFCSGKDFDEAFGLMDTAEKAAEI